MSAQIKELEMECKRVNNLLSNSLKVDSIMYLCSKKAINRVSLTR